MHRTLPNSASISGTAALGRRGWPPLGEYAAVGNCHTVALVSARGWLEWLCLPRFDGPSVFAALLDRADGGELRLEAAHAMGTARWYDEATPVLRTEVGTRTGHLLITDFMPAHEGTSLPGVAPGAGMVCRLLECTEGTVHLGVRYRPRPGYGAAPVRLRRDTATGGWLAGPGAGSVRLRSDLPVTERADELACSVSLRRGERRWLVVEDAASTGSSRPGDMLASTVAWWRRWAQRLRYAGPYHAEVLRSAITLKLLCHAPTGAVVAAPTTSLPEVPGGTSNWDYRFCWIRDASMCVRALIRSGFSDEAHAFLTWLVRVAGRRTPELHVLYSVDGRHVLPERSLDHLTGYRGSRPVRVGNAAHAQLQLDVYGALMDAVHVHVRAGGRLREETASLLVALGKRVCELWHQPDNGIWESRLGRRHHTLSKGMCWTALDRLIRLHEAGELQAPVAAFRHEAALIREAVNRFGVDAGGRFVVRFNEDAVDPSLLLLDIYGYDPPGSRRTLATLRRVDRRLGPPPLLDRCLESGGPGKGRQGAFVVAGFWAVEALAKAGLADEAERRFQSILSTANDLGLFAEETRRENGALAGNFPQGLSHIGLLNAAAALAHARGYQRADLQHPPGSRARSEPL